MSRTGPGADDLLASDVAAPSADHAAAALGAPEAVPAIAGDRTGSGAELQDPASAPEAVSTVARLVDLKGKDHEAAWSTHLRTGEQAVAAAVRLLAESDCACCGRRWGLRALAGRLDQAIPREYGRPRYGGALSHSTLSRIARHSSSYGQRVDSWTYREVGRAIVTAFGAASP